MIAVGIIIFCCFIFAILEGGRRLYLLLNRMQGRASMARYVDRWPVTKA